MARLNSSTSINAGQAAPTNTAANIVDFSAPRRRITLVNHGSVDVYLGEATVTTSNGLNLKVGASITLETQAAIQGITASGTGAIHYIEEYD